MIDLNLLDFEPWWRFGAALLIGALLGLEREFIQQRDKTPDIAGIRTFLLIALLGAVTAFLTAAYGPLLMGIALSGLILLTIVSYFGALYRQGVDPGITTEVAVVLTFLFGVMVMGDSVVVAMALAVLTSLFLALKGRLHGIIRGMNTEDLRITLQFALVALVILPLLPDRPLDPFGLLNPFQIWLMVVLISGVGFSGYVLMKVFGASRGINLTGLLGGLASSTATTISFSSASRDAPALSAQFARAVVLASIVLLPRVALLVAVVAPGLVAGLLLPLGSMFFTGLLAVLWMGRRDQTRETAPESVQVSNPLNISTAVKFGLLFSIVLIATEFAQGLFGDTGVLAAGALAGLTDADAVTLSVGRLFVSGQIGSRVAAIAVMLAVLANTVTKALIVHFSGTTTLRRHVWQAYAVILAAGISATWILLV